MEITKKDFKNEVLDSPIPVLVDFWATWCTPCQMMAPVLEELAAEMEGKIKIVKVNTEDSANEELAIEYQIQNIPNMKLFQGGKVIAEFVGLRNKEDLRADIETFLK